MKLQSFLSCSMILVTVCQADELKLPSAGFEDRQMPPEGWQIFEFGDNGSIKRITATERADADNRGCLRFEIGGGGGGQGLFTDVKVSSLSVSDQLEFRIKARLLKADALDEGKLEIHIEYIADGEPVGRTDELGTSVSIEQQDLTADKWKTVTHKHTIGRSDVSDLSNVDTVRFVIVAIQPDDGFKESYGSVLVDDAAAKHISADR